MVRCNPPLYPTPQHEAAALYATEFFSEQDSVDAVLLTCSCARGKAAPSSCVDISVLLRSDTDLTTRERLNGAWANHSGGAPVVAALASHGAYAHIDVNVTNGDFQEGYHGWCSGPDEFELEIGNLLQYSVPLYETGCHLQEMRDTWLPYYSPEIRDRRLAMAAKYCLNNIDHVASFVERRLFFQAFRRLYNAAGEFLQTLFIARRKYPIAYDKWIEEQLVEILVIPELYPRFIDLHSIRVFESSEIRDKAESLRDMFDEYCREEIPSNHSIQPPIAADA